MKKFLSILSAISLAAALTVSSSAALLGDVNSDGEINYDMVVNSSDALKVLRISVGLEKSDIALTEKAEILD